MDCTGVDLVAYHLGSIEERERDAVEAHLVACRACLRTYLAIKRAADRAELDRPRPEVRARLRAEVARAFPPRARPSVGHPVLTRRIPLYQGVVLAALAAAVAVAAPSVLHRVSRIEAGGDATSIDTSRTRAESLHIY
jgi:anti-sigma factor RsiW